MAGDAGGDEELARRALRGAELFGFGIERDLAAREGKGGGVAFVLGPTVFACVVGRVVRLLAHELAFDEGGNGLDLGLVDDAAEGLHRRARAALLHGVGDLVLAQRGLREVARARREVAAGQRGRITRIAMAEVAAEVVDGAPALVQRGGPGLQHSPAADQQQNCAGCQQRRAPAGHVSVAPRPPAWR